MSTKPSWLYQQSAVIPIFDDKIVLITSRRKKRWIIPKGVIELGLAPEDSAAKEALEEAGVVGSVSPRELGMGRSLYRTGLRVSCPQIA